MANIHTLSSLGAPFPTISGSTNQSQNIGGQSGGPHIGAQQSSSIPIMDESATTPGRVPKCVELFLPGFKFKTVIFGFSVIQTIIFIATCVYGSYALIPSTGTLIKFGASYGPLIQIGQVWRLFTPIFLHASIWHLLINVFFQMRMGFGLERYYSHWIFLGLYVLTGFSGNCLSVAWAPCKVSVGASTAGFGLIGLQISEIALAFHLIEQKNQVLLNLAFFAFMTIMMSLSPGGAVVDWRGHLGGFIAGLSLGFSLNKRSVDEKPKWAKSAIYVSLVILSIEILGCLIGIFVVPMSTRCK